MAVAFVLIAVLGGLFGAGTALALGAGWLWVILAYVLAGNLAAAGTVLVLVLRQRGDLSASDYRPAEQAPGPSAQIVSLTSR